MAEQSDRKLSTALNILVQVQVLPLEESLMDRVEDLLKVDYYRPFARLPIY